MIILTTRQGCFTRSSTSSWIVTSTPRSWRRHCCTTGARTPLAWRHPPQRIKHKHQISAFYQFYETWTKSSIPKQYNRTAQKVSYRVVSCRIVSYRIVSCRIVSYRIVLYRTVSLVSYRIAEADSRLNGVNLLRGIGLYNFHGPADFDQEIPAQLLHILRLLSLLLLLVLLLLLL